MKCHVTDKIADALRQKLKGGMLKVGDPMPSVAELRARFGAGSYSVRQALRRLRDEGYLDLRRHVGAIATEKCSLGWKGRIAFVRVGTNASYFSSRLLIALTSSLESAGWSLEPVFIRSTGNSEEDPAPLRRHIANGLSFAILYCQSHGIVELLDRFGVPYIVLNGFTRDFPNAMGVVREDFGPAYRDLIAALKERGVRRAVEFDRYRRMDRGFAAMLVGAGIKMKWVMCDEKEHGKGTPLGEEGREQNTLGDFRSYGHRAVAEFFGDARRRVNPPDVIVFDDDYLAAGGIAALFEAGLRIPRDVRLVTYSNAGNEMTLGISIARIQNDPVDYGETVAAYVLKLLTGRNAQPPRIVWRFIPGDSL